VESGASPAKLGEVTQSKPTSPARGTVANPPSRFQRLQVEADADYDPSTDPLPRTRFYRDQSTTVLTRNDSPDVGSDFTLNPYRGCEHGCIYCYARQTHEYLGFSSGLDFETKIIVKERAAELLRQELSSPKWKPQPLGMSGVTDCYQPIERKLKITRACLEVLAEFRNPVNIVTKNNLVTRDIDLLSELANYNAASVCISLTTLDTELRGVLEPRTSPPAARLSAIRQVAAAGIPVGVLVAPIIPGLTDHEIPALLSAAAEAGASFAGYEMLRLPYANKELFERWLEQHFPEKKDKVLSRIRAVRGGKLNDSRFGSRMRGEGIFADQIHQMFEVARRKVGLSDESPTLSAASFRRPSGPQLELEL
jgi:DNA repair photolyase